MRNTLYSCLLSLFLPGFLWGAPLQIHTEAQAALLINAESGAVLYEKRPNHPYPPASTIKLATALYTVVKMGDRLDEVVTVSRNAVASITPKEKIRTNYTKPSYLLETDTKITGIKVGEQITLRHLLYAHLVGSGGDTSNAIAEYVSGTIPKFVEEVNGFLKTLGCKATHMTNPHGLHHPSQLTTAKDLALIARECLKYPLLRTIMASSHHKLPKSNKQEEINVYQTNKLLRKGPHFYSYAIGGKTGWHSRAKHTFVGIAEKDGRTLIAVLLRCKSRDQLFNETKKLFDRAFREEKMRRLYFRKGDQKFSLQLQGAARPIRTTLQEDVFLEFYPSEEPQVQASLSWLPMELPIQKGTKVGHLELQNEEGTFKRRVPLYAMQDVQPTLWLVCSTQAHLLLHSHWFLAFLTLAFTGLFYVDHKRRSKKEKHKKKHRSKKYGHHKKHHHRK